MNHLPTWQVLVLVLVRVLMQMLVLVQELELVLVLKQELELMLMRDIPGLVV